MKLNRKWVYVAWTGLVAMALTACGPKDGSEADRAGGFQLTSEAFQEGQPIPIEYTCQGYDMSPAIAWSGVPATAKSLALICEDPDAANGAWVHWVLYGLPVSVQSLDENVPTTETLPNGAKQGENDFKRIGYGGPCPPAGKAHHYVFHLYALDASLDLKPGATKADLVKAMAGHQVGEAKLTGTFESK